VILSAVADNFPNFRSQHIVWDLWDATMNRMVRSDFEAIAQTCKAINDNRGAARTAFVGASQETIALTCMYTGLAAEYGTNIEYGAFGSIDQAVEWVNQPQGADIRY
jgi:hypothetical protein